MSSCPDSKLDSVYARSGWRPPNALQSGKRAKEIREIATPGLDRMISQDRIQLTLRSAHPWGPLLPSDQSSDSKRDALRRHGAANPHPENVGDPLFEDSDFFDRRDLVQVKYEMLRRVREDGMTVTMASRRFGFSRVTFYEALRVFEDEGLVGLVPKKPGPRGGHKLTDEVVAFLAAQRQGEPSVDVAELVQRVQAQFGVTVHPRSIVRVLAKPKKKP